MVSRRCRSFDPLKGVFAWWPPGSFLLRTLIFSQVRLEIFFLQLYSVFVTNGGRSCKAHSRWCLGNGCLLLGRATSTTHFIQHVPLHVSYPLAHAVYNDGDEAHHPSVAMPCFFQAQVIHNAVGVAVGQRETIGRGVPAVQPWEPPSDPPWKSRIAQPAISQKQKSMDRTAC